MTSGGSVCLNNSPRFKFDPRWITLGAELPAAAVRACVQPIIKHVTLFFSPSSHLQFPGTCHQLRNKPPGK